MFRREDKMKLAVFVLILMVMLPFTGHAGIIRSGSLQGGSDGVNVTLYWITEDESNVDHFAIERRAGAEGAFLSIADVSAGKGPSYEYVDNSVFRKTESLYQYRLKIVFSNGASPVYTTIISVSHTVSGIRRTWGSIKAMFH